jgi:thymidylate synthase
VARLGGPDGRRFDQLARPIHSINTNPGLAPADRLRLEPAEATRLALPPCNLLIQTHVANGRLSLQLYQRSAECLGVSLQHRQLRPPHHILAQQCGLEAGDFRLDRRRLPPYFQPSRSGPPPAHREPGRCRSSRSCAPDAIDRYEYEDFEITGYDPHPHIKAEVAV